MTKTIRNLFLISFLMLTIGGASYYYGSRQNLESQTATRTAGDSQIEDVQPMQVSQGDKWLFAGGAIALLGCSLALGTIKFWLQERRKDDATAIGVA